MLIQQTLDNIVNGRTTISIAHRVKTIMNSDQIFVMKEGKLLERGKFKDLARFRGRSEANADDEGDPIKSLKKMEEENLDKAKLAMEPEI